MNETIKTLTTRRSVRAYKPDQIKDSDLDAILEAGLYAANGMGRQNPVAVVVQCPDAIAKLGAANAAAMGMDSDPFYGAPTVICALADPAAPTYKEDCALMLGNMMNAAFSLGVDSCYVYRCKEQFETEEGRAILKDAGVPDGLEGVGCLILGYRDGDLPEAAPRREGRIFKVLP